MWKWRFIQMTSHLSASQKKKKKREGGCQRVLRNLIFSDKITNNLLIPRSLSVWLSLSLSHSNGSTHTHTHKHQRSAVSKVPWQSITAVETAQVLCMRKTLAKTSMRIWTLHTHGHTTLFKIQPFICAPLLSNICCSRGYPHHVFVCNTRLRGITINS